MSAESISADGLLILPHRRIQNANAISSPLTHGFPSITAFLGLRWALERKLADAHIGISFEAIGVICHAYQEQINEGYINTFNLTRNPVGRDGSTAAIIEEGRMHLDITLVFAAVWNPDDPSGNIFSKDAETRQQVADRIANIFSAGRVAGGSVLPSQAALGRRIRPQLLALPEDLDERQRQFRRLRRQWLPGFALVSRDDLLQQRQQQLQALNGQATLLDAWLDLSRFNWRPKSTPEGEAASTDGKVEWQHDRPAGSGWIVPIPVGYGALEKAETYPAGQVANARDSTTPFRFVESLYSIGQWISPHRLSDVNQLLWYTTTDTESGLYRCRNHYAASAADTLPHSI